MDEKVTVRVLTEGGELVSETDYPSRGAASVPFEDLADELVPGEIVQLIVDDRVAIEIYHNDTDVDYTSTY